MELTVYRQQHFLKLIDILLDFTLKMMMRVLLVLVLEIFIHQEVHYVLLCRQQN